MRNRITILTVLLWLALAAGCAYTYVHDRITAPDAAQGYETTWNFQLLMFSIFRLPLFLVALALVVRIERHFWRPRGSLR
jgi:hypothetical protein